MGKAITHGWRTVENRKLYGRCNNIRLRCHDPRNKMFHHYGDRFNSTEGELPDVYLHDEWHKPNVMCDWVKEHLGWPIVLNNNFNDPEVVGLNLNETSIKVELDRINNNGGYEPENIAWVSKSKNHLNRRDSHGKTGTRVFREWDRIRRMVKENKAECDPRWNSRGSHSHGKLGFKVFLREMFDHPELIKQLDPDNDTKWMIARIDQAQPYSSTNCVWVENLGGRKFSKNKVYTWVRYTDEDGQGVLRLLISRI